MDSRIDCWDFHIQISQEDSWDPSQGEQKVDCLANPLDVCTLAILLAAGS
jgi:hypothetical protein